MGIVDSYDFFKTHLSDDQAEQLLLDYVNSNTNALIGGIGKYWLDQPIATNRYESLDSVMKAFDDAIEHVYVPQPYDTNKLAYANDEFLYIVGSSVHGDVNNPWYSVWDSLQNSESDTVMDSFKKMASVAVYVHPEYQEQFACLKYIDLSSEVVFGEEFKESSFDVRCRLGLETKRGISGFIVKRQKDKELKRDLELKRDFENREIRDTEQKNILENSLSVRKTNAILNFDSVVEDRTIKSDDFEFG